MALLMTTFGFLFIFFLYSTTQFSRLLEFSLTNEVYAEVYDEGEERIRKAVVTRANTNYYAAAKSYDEELEPPEDDGVESAPQRQSTPRLSRKLHLPQLLSQQPAQPHDKTYEASLLLLQHLIRTLYDDAPFFKDAKVKHPKLEEELIHKVLLQVHEHKMKLAEHIANIDLKDEDLQVVLFKILAGSKRGDEEGGYPSLLQFISFQSKPQAVAVYLAPREILLALFQDEQVVSDILTERNILHSMVKKENMSALEEQFKARFASKLPSYIEPNMVSFRVTKTKP